MQPIKTDKTAQVTYRILPTIAAEEYIVINSDGVKTSDVRGNRFYRGRPQSRIEMTGVYFAHAQEFWRNQTLNGAPLELREIVVQTAANSAIPYNSPAQRRTMPRSAPSQESNRVAWYNVKFAHGETGWICNRLYRNLKEAAEGAAVDTVYQIYNDKKVIDCIQKVLLQNQK